MGRSWLREILRESGGSMPETKAEFKTRLMAVGKWAAFVGRRDELKRQGLAPKDARRNALEEIEEDLYQESLPGDPSVPRLCWPCVRAGRPSCAPCLQMFGIPTAPSQSSCGQVRCERLGLKCGTCKEAEADWWKHFQRWINLECGKHRCIGLGECNCVNSVAIERCQPAV
jgi:hypothetical protein